MYGAKGSDVAVVNLMMMMPTSNQVLLPLVEPLHFLLASTKLHVMLQASRVFARWSLWPLEAILWRQRSNRFAAHCKGVEQWDEVPSDNSLLFLLCALLEFWLGLTLLREATPWFDLPAQVRASSCLVDSVLTSVLPPYIVFNTERTCTVLHFGTRRFRFGKAKVPNTLMVL